MRVFVTRAISSSRCWLCRALQVESDTYIAAVQATEVPVGYVVFPDEGHGFRKRENRIVASDAHVRFLNTYLGTSE